MHKNSEGQNKDSAIQLQTWSAGTVMALLDEYKIMMQPAQAEIWSVVVESAGRMQEGWQ